MNLNDLKNIKIDLNSLKNFSLEDIRNFINEQQVLALNLVIGFSMILVMGFVVNMHVQEYAVLKKKVGDLSAKEDPVHHYEKVMKQSAAFWKTVPSAVPEDQMISFITQVATRRGIVINTFDPPSTGTGSFYHESRVSFTCAPAGFRDLLLFIHDLESSTYLVKVNTFSLRRQDSGFGTGGGQAFSGDTRLVLGINVSFVELMDNGKKNPKK